MRLALEKARENLLAGGGPFGAVVVKDGQVVATGCNRVCPELDPTAHAEMVAIREACQALGVFHLTGAVLYASTEPCPMCLAACYWARLERVYYATNRRDAAAAGFIDEKLYREVCLPPGQRELPLTEDGREEALALFRLWENLPDKMRY
ncbi:MAG: nucleoside deaminase [Deltaproteobacteria bacterium]|nr:nucleoside deaminase [Deltaproteobacteria bacterium]